MRIGMVSTYPPIECGIATYSQYLTNALMESGNEVYVFSQYGGKGDHVFGCYSPQEKTIAGNIFEMVSKMTPDVVHIQHEFGLWGGPVVGGNGVGIQVIELVLRCRMAGLPVLMTFHTVREKFNAEEQETVIRLLLQESDGIIVHGDYYKKILSEHFGHAGKIHVIPHGVREMEEVGDARKKVGVEGKKVILVCGYMRASKGSDKVVEIFPKVAEAVDNAILVIATRSRSVDHPEYQKELYRMVEESPVADRIVVLHGQFPQHIFDTLLSAADVMALPYEVGGQSGMMAHCFAFSKPVITSNLRSLRDLIDESGGGLVANSDEELADHLIRILTDDELSRSLSRNIVRFVSDKVSWRVVAGQHMNVYQKYAWCPTPKSRYFG